MIARMDSKRPRSTTPEEEDIGPDAMERLERAIKTAVRHGPVQRKLFKKAGRSKTKGRPIRASG
jgi:hypothetical protein